MSSDRQDDNPAMPADGPPEPVRPAVPFARAPIQWGRPPQVVFQAGPLPRGERLDPLPEMPRAPAPRLIAPPAPGFGGSIHSGSMIPRARPAVATGPVPISPAAGPERAPLPPVAPIAAARPTFTPPPQLEPIPEPTVVDSPIFEVTDAVADVMPERVAQPSSVSRRRPNRMPIYAGIAAVAVVGVASAVWFMTRPDRASVPATVAPTIAPETALPAPTSTVPVATVPTVAAVPPETGPAPVAPARTATPAAPPATTERTVVRPATRSATTSTVRAPTVQPTQQPEAPAPVIVVAPLVPAGPPPTVAQPSQADPDAPIVTRPQPLE